MTDIEILERKILIKYQLVALTWKEIRSMEEKLKQEKQKKAA